MTLVLLLTSLVGVSAYAAAIPVEVVESDGHYQLTRGGQPYEVKGAGHEFADFDAFTSHGGNSIRNWSTVNPKIKSTWLSHK